MLDYVSDETLVGVVNCGIKFLLLLYQKGDILAIIPFFYGILISPLSYISPLSVAQENKH